MTKKWQSTVGNGCNLHNDCLTCPFADCIVSTKRATENEELKNKAITLFNSSSSIAEIAIKLNRSQMTIRRWINARRI